MVLSGLNELDDEYKQHILKLFVQIKFLKKEFDSSFIKFGIFTAKS